MRTALAAILCTVVGASNAIAEPRESVTFTNVYNDGMRNWVQNEFRDCIFQGGYMASKVRISGTIRSLVPMQTLLETQIAVAAPDWNIIWVYPFGDLADEYQTFTLVDSEFELESPVFVNGGWAFQFFDTADDPTGPDAIWETVTITLDDAPPPQDIWYEYLKIDAGESVETADKTRGEGALTQIRGFGSATDSDLFHIFIDDPANFTASAQLLRYFGDGAMLSLFYTDGTPIVAIDARTPYTPTIDNSLAMLTPGDYLLGITTAHRYPVDGAGNRLWDETLNQQHLPSPAATGPLAHWEGHGETIQFHIMLSGVAFAGHVNTCTADYDQDGAFGQDADIEAFFLCLGGMCCQDCNPDFNNDGAAGQDSDIESFFSVLGGGAC